MRVVSKPRARAETQAAAIIRDRLSERVDEAGRASLGVPGGRSVAGVLEELAATDAPFNAVDIFFVDERCVPADSEERNERVLETSLLAPLARRRAAPPANRVHTFTYEETSPDFGAASYEQELTRAAGHLDVALLGVGEDGHIASLFPGRPEVQEAKRLYVPVDGAPKPPPKRVSASPALLSAPGTMVVLLFFGTGKKEALKAFVAGEGTPEECPARLVKDAQDLWVITDIGAG